MSSKFFVVAYFGVNSFQASGEASWKGFLGESSTQRLPDSAESGSEEPDLSDSVSFEPSVRSGTT